MASGVPTPAALAGRAAEDASAALLERHGLALVARNYRTRFGEIDIVARDGDTLVFVEVRARAGRGYGGAAASVDGVKQRKLVAAARHFLARLGREPACRFDVVSWEGGRARWIRGAFELA